MQEFVCTCYVWGAHTHCTPQIKARGEGEEGGEGCKTHTTQRDARHPPGKNSRRVRVSPQASGLLIPPPFVACQLGSRGGPGRCWVGVRSANTLRVHRTFLSTHTGWLTTAVFQGSNGLSGVHGHCIYLVTLREHAINLATLERSEEFRGRRLSCFTRLAALWPSAGRHPWPTHPRLESCSRLLNPLSTLHYNRPWGGDRWLLTFPVDLPFTRLPRLMPTLPHRSHQQGRAGPSRAAMYPLVIRGQTRSRLYGGQNS